MIRLALLGCAHIHTPGFIKMLALAMVALLLS
jgi:hypothetical protein